MNNFTWSGLSGRYISIALIAMLINACATVPTPLPETSHTQQQWQSRQAEIDAYKDWAATGRIAIRKAEDGWSASYEWQQSEAAYAINLRGPLGYGVLQLNGSDSYAELSQAGKAPYRAASAEQLLQEQTGWQLPVEGLRYWIRGLPMPNRNEQHLMNEHAAPIKLEQDGWVISYSRYKQVNGIWLPGKLTLANADLQVKLLVDQWQLPLER